MERHIPFGISPTLHPARSVAPDLRPGADGTVRRVLHTCFG